jgi:hemoglobin-like flavoprotein
MNETTIELVQKSWAKVLPNVDAVGDLFYNNLFELDPELKKLFKGDIKAQGKKLMQMISVAVSKLRNLDTLVPALQELGARHVDYNVEAPHYDTVASALVKTLGEGLGDEFTDELKAAWVEVYGLIAKTMIDAADARRANAA